MKTQGCRNIQKYTNILKKIPKTLQMSAIRHLQPDSPHGAALCLPTVITEGDQDISALNGSASVKFHSLGEHCIFFEL